jgi:AcrR family transcriptional regulator
MLWFLIHYVETVNDGQAMHPTKRLLIDQVKLMMKSRLSRQIGSEEILTGALISKGSLYHHFKDFSELIEVAQIEIYRANSNQQVLTIANEISDQTNPQECYETVCNFMKIKKESLSLFERQERAIIIADALLGPRLNIELKQAETETLLAWKTLFEKCVQFGWGDPALHGDSIALMTEVILNGRLAGDISLEFVSIQRWLVLLNGFIRGTYFRNAQVR